MKGLLLKDLYTLTKSLRVFLLLIVVFSCLPGLNMSVFAVVYAALLPVTALSYDERSKWDTLAAMLPYSTREIVLSKYLLGYGAMLGAFLIALATHGIYGLLNVSPESEFISSIAGGAVGGVTVMALSLPVIFKLGVEKGRIAFYVIIALLFAVVAGAETLIKGGMTELMNRIGNTAGVVVCLVIVALNLLSIFLSIRFYSRREF